MSFKKILNETVALKYIKIEIDDVFEIIEEDLQALEIKYDLFSFSTIGSLIFKDSYNFKNNGLLSLNGTNKIKITMTDLADVKSVRYYNITNITSDPEDENRFQLIHIDFIDEFAFILKNTYLSKGFKETTPIAAFQQYLTHLGIDDILETNKMQYNIVDPGISRDFVVPQNVSVFDFFQEMFIHENVHMFQDRKTFYIKEIKPLDLEMVLDPNGEDLEFTDDTMNNTYLFKMHDHTIKHNSKMVLNIENPVEKIYRYNYEKKIVHETTNLLDFVPDITLNDFDTTGIQETQGERFSTQGYFYNLNQKHNLFETCINNNVLYIVVPGTLTYGVLGSLVKVKFKGNPIFSDSASKGNEYVNGKYIITGISDKVFGDKLIQRIQLSRFDNTKPSLVEG